MRRQHHRLLGLFFLVYLLACTAKVEDPKIYTGFLGEDYFGDTYLPDEGDYAPPGLSLLTFKGGEYIRPGGTEEIRWILKPQEAGDIGLFSSQIEYSNDGGVTWIQIPGAIRIPAISGEVVSFNWDVPAVSGDSFLLRVTIQNSIGEKKYAQSDSPFSLDSDVPTIQAGTFLIEGGKANVRKSYFKYSVALADATSPLVSFCPRLVSADSTEDIIPALDDGCWRKILDLPEVNRTIGSGGKSVVLNNLNFVLGFVPGLFLFRVWVRDTAGNISVLTNGYGEEDLDKLEIPYTPAAPVKFLRFYVANNTAAQNPPLPEDGNMTSTGTGQIYAFMKTDQAPVETKMSYSVDGGGTYTVIAGATDCSGSEPSGFNACVSGSLPQTASPVLVKVELTSDLNMRSSAVSSPINIPKFRVLAGNLDRGVGGSAIAAGYAPKGQGNLVVNSKGQIFVNDINRGLLIISPDDGSVRTYLKVDSNLPANKGEGLSVDQASSTGIHRINIDFQDNIFLIERTLIRKISPEGIISTVLGGGTASSGGVPFFPISDCGWDGATDTAEIRAIKQVKNQSTGEVIYPAYSAAKSDYYDSAKGFLKAKAMYRSGSQGSLILRTIEEQNFANASKPGYKIKTENIFYQEEFKNIILNINHDGCGRGRRPTLEFLPNGDFIFDGFHTRNIFIGTAASPLPFNRMAEGPNWYAYYQAATAKAPASVRLIPLKGSGVLTKENGSVVTKPDQTFEAAIPASNLGVGFDPQKNKFTVLHSRGAVLKNGVFTDPTYSINFNPKNGSGVFNGLQFIPEAWFQWAQYQQFTSKKGELYSMMFAGGYNGLYKYMSTTNRFERILGTGTIGQCPDGTKVLECNVDIQDAFIDQNDRVYFFDRDRLRVILKKSGSYKDSIVMTLMGFSKSAGDATGTAGSGDSLSARFKQIRSVGFTEDSRLIVHDSGESVVRQFSVNTADPQAFKMKRIAGNPFAKSAPTYEVSGSVTLSKEKATDALLNFNRGVFNDRAGNLYARPGNHVFSRLNTTGANQGKWEVLLGNPADPTGSAAVSKFIWGTGATSCDAVVSPADCNAKNREYFIGGLIEGLETDSGGNPLDFLVFSTWNYYKPLGEAVARNTDAAFKFLRTSVDGGPLLRNLSTTPAAGLNRFPYTVADSAIVKNTANFPLDPLMRYQYIGGVNNNKGILVVGNGVWWAKERAIRYLELDRDASGKVTNMNRIGTLLDNVSISGTPIFDSTIDSFHVSYTASEYTAFVCLTNGVLKKVRFRNSLGSHILATATKATNVNVTSIALPSYLRCGGVSMEYDLSRKKLYFPVTYDGLWGVGEYDDN